MAQWKKVLTDRGRALDASSVGKIFSFTGAACSDGSVAMDVLHEQTALSGKSNPLSITAISSEGAARKLRLQLKNDALTARFQLRQIGVFAQVADGAPILYQIMQRDEPETIPAALDSPNYVADYLVNTTVENAAQVTAIIDSAAYLTRGEMGTAGGIASLGEDGKVPAAQLPVMDFDPAGSAAAVQTALSGHTGDNVRHLTAAERTAWNAKADGASTSAHISNTNNPHGVTAAQVGAVPLSGGTLTGNLDIAKTIASVVLRTGDSSNRLSGRLMKNANVEGTVDDGLYLTDYGADGSEATLKIQGGQQRLRIKLGGTDYAVYHEGSKPTPADIGAARLICGSYIGTGTAGVSNPCSITFEAAPKLIYLLGSKKPNGVFTWYSLKDHSDSSGHYLWGIYMGALTTVYTENTGFLTDSTELGATSYGKKSSDGKTYYWYVDMASLSSSQQAYGPGLQCNVSGNTYYYAALC
ncbi:hypothetical protein [Intestinimonas butyriciproducens]|uniref:hypothetical protein n=1 Tax=Intestinimonas butyriciproducens TaxID=1297617 RepID=UPI001AB04BA6|nr:hypothetical protein [Intestinimonas butyriciproducens]MBO3278335.1 hypothetical protein [Intestinimonas butyriciproducens]